MLNCAQFEMHKDVAFTLHYAIRLRSICEADVPHIVNADTEINIQGYFFNATWGQGL